MILILILACILLTITLVWSVFIMMYILRCSLDTTKPTLDEEELHDYIPRSSGKIIRGL